LQVLYHYYYPYVKILPKKQYNGKEESIPIKEEEDP
jgi:hypothetical protein